MRRGGPWYGPGADLQAVEQRFDGELGGVKSDLSGEIGQLGETFKGLCLQLAREIDAKVSSLDAACAERRDALELEVKTQIVEAREVRENGPLSTDRNVPLN
jgi:hypothetical protein